MEMLTSVESYGGCRSCSWRLCLKLLLCQPDNGTSVPFLKACRTQMAAQTGGCSYPRSCTPTRGSAWSKREAGSTQLVALMESMRSIASSAMILGPSTPLPLAFVVKP